MDFLGNFRARILARKSACPAHAAAGRSAALAARSARRLAYPTFASRGCPLEMQAFTRVRVLCMINYRVQIYKLHYRLNPNGQFGVGVGPVEFLSLTDSRK